MSGRTLHETTIMRCLGDGMLLTQLVKKTIQSLIEKDPSYNDLHEWVLVKEIQQLVRDKKIRCLEYILTEKPLEVQWFLYPIKSRVIGGF